MFVWILAQRQEKHAFSNPKHCTQHKDYYNYALPARAINLHDTYLLLSQTDRICTVVATMSSPWGARGTNKSNKVLRFVVDGNGLLAVWNLLLPRLALVLVAPCTFRGTPHSGTSCSYNTLQTLYYTLSVQNLATAQQQQWCSPACLVTCDPRTQLTDTAGGKSVKTRKKKKKLQKLQISISFNFEPIL